MAKKASKETETLSKSKQKRTQRHKEVEKEKREKLVKRIVGIILAVVIIGALLFTLGYNIYKVASRTTSSSDFSQGLTDSGLIDGVDTASCLTLVDFENMVIPKDEVAATTEEVDNDIQSTLESNKELKDDASLTIADSDKVNIDYVGTIDGIAFDGGDSAGAGYDLTIGSGTFVDDFEEQLVGHHPGEELTVEVTFPDDYSTADLAGKDASFAVTIHGIYITPVFNDEFVKTYLSDQASTADEYRASVEDKFYQSHLSDYITTYIMDNSTVIKYPSSYLKAARQLTKYNDEYTLSYYNQMFSSYGMSGYENVWDTRDGIDDEAAYEKELRQRAKDAVKEDLVYQAIFEKAGLSLDMDAYVATLTETNGEDTVNTMKEMYGLGYMAQSRIKELVVEYLTTHANVQ